MVLWKYSTTKDATVERQAREVFEKYSNDIFDDIIDEIKGMKKIRIANISSSISGPLIC